MRLDTVGKPPLLQNDNFERLEVGKIKKENIGEVGQAPESGNSTSSEGGQRLGRILNLFEERGQKKRKRGPFRKNSSHMDFSVENDPLNIYKMIARAGGTSFRSTKGQHLDVKV